MAGLEESTAGIRVLLADDHAVLRAGLRMMLEAQRDIEVVAESADAPLTLSEVARTRPEIVVLDLSMPGGGTALIEELRNLHPRCRVVVLTMYDGPSHLREAISRGADAFVSKTAAGSELLVAIRSVHAGRSFFAATLVDAPSVELSIERKNALIAGKFSGREIEVLQMVAMGYANKEVACALSISVKSVETYRSRIAEKAGFTSRAQLVRYALDVGLIGPRPH